jgi:hypothetical protein
MREISGAVERVDDPSMIAFMIARTAFFGEDRMGRKIAMDRFDDRGLGFLISLGHQIDRVALASGFGFVEPAKMNPAGGACGT